MVINLLWLSDRDLTRTIMYMSKEIFGDEFYTQKMSKRNILKLKN